MQDRRLKTALIEDLNEKMVLLSGPRQCGKTTFCQGLLEGRSGRYYNWDIERDRKALRLGQIDEAAKLWVFDELHKLRTWKKWLKGADRGGGDAPTAGGGGEGAPVVGGGGAAGCAGCAGARGRAIDCTGRAITLTKGRRWPPSPHGYK
jgi:hypothetical protein